MRDLVTTTLNEGIQHDNQTSDAYKAMSDVLRVYAKRHKPVFITPSKLEYRPAPISTSFFDEKIKYDYNPGDCDIYIPMSTPEPEKYLILTQTKNRKCLES